MIFLYKAFLTSFRKTSKQVSYEDFTILYGEGWIGEKNVFIKGLKNDL
ncbi:MULTISPECIES: hypothetical protein [Heyndrickxia]|nr:hypothetical protein [Heyndrickxia oleronia]NYV67985.1 hypothetical protein [Bacillus sp. Gen3]MBU5212011.1 hypothetical protein [Heyndrickxia oleronia]MCI1591603.1 hypothetical protein [Heyndrickxia oleronia]MCI1613011.1 hypothetical protein [Heyndrickxia oleronia]MCI1744238.1 hypothetical protein [Heyndrickxia oleronia]